MKSWNIITLDAKPHTPHIVSSSDDARAIVLHLPAGERLQDHKVHERAWIMVVDGEVEVRAGDEAQTGGPGFLAEFDPGERHEVRAVSDSRFLLFLAPWGGEGHPGTMTLQEKAEARERASERSDGDA